MKGTTLGTFLKAAREGRKLTLREVERVTGISNPYLSQLEGDKIKQPSPVWLHKLSEVYGLAYADLLALAGYPVPGAGTDKGRPSSLAARLGPVTPDEEESLAEYLDFIRARRNRRR